MHLLGDALRHNSVVTSLKLVGLDASATDAIAEPDGPIHRALIINTFIVAIHLEGVPVPSAWQRICPRRRARGAGGGGHRGRTGRTGRTARQSTAARWLGSACACGRPRLQRPGCAATAGGAPSWFRSARRAAAPAGCRRGRSRRPSRRRRRRKNDHGQQAGLTGSRRRQRALPAITG